jgi:hypothetical protein
VNNRMRVELLGPALYSFGCGWVEGRERMAELSGGNLMVGGRMVLFLAMSHERRH